MNEAWSESGSAQGHGDSCRAQTTVGTAGGQERQ